jgi:hypothetical protein
VERAAGPRVERPVRMSGLPGSCWLSPVVSGPRAESVLISGLLWSRPIMTSQVPTKGAQMSGNNPTPPSRAGKPRKSTGRTRWPGHQWCSSMACGCCRAAGTRWTALFDDAGYAAITVGWPDDPETVEEANAHPGQAGHNPANHHRAVPLTFEQFRYGFANAVDEEQAKRLYETSAPSSTPRRARCLGGHSYGGCVITNASRRCRPAASRNCRARQADRGRPLRRHQSTYLPIIAST